METFDRAIKDHLNQDGSFGDPQKPDTHFFALELATSFLTLRDALDDATRWHWLDALTKMIDYLINLLINALLPHVDQKEWVLDATKGARHSLKLPFSTCGLAVAAWCGNRPDLGLLLAEQFRQGVQRNYLGNARQGWGSSAFYRGYGSDLGVWLQAAALAEGEAAGR